MKRILISLTILSALSVQAQKFDWLTTLSATETTKSQTNIQYAAFYADSSALVFGNYGSLYADDYGVLGGQQYKGAEYGGTSNGYNKNFILAKLDKNGEVLWAIHSEDGDVSDSQSAVTLTSDGGAVLALKFRHSEHNKQDGVSSPIYKIVDATGAGYSRSLEYPGARIYQPVLLRVDKDGKIATIKDMWCSSEKAAKGTGSTTDAFSWSAATEDVNGHIYIAGSQSLNMALGEDTLYARAQPDWDGTTTNGRYNGFVIKLDSDLKYISHIASDGTILTDKANCMVYRDNTLYLTGLAKAEDHATLKIDDKQVDIKELCVINVCLTTDLTARWLSAMPIIRYNERQGNNLYQTALSEDGTRLYTTGCMQGAIVFNNDTIHSGGTQLSTMNDGYIYAFSTTDGSLQKASVIGDKTLNINQGIVEYGDSLYVYNYLFGNIRQIIYNRELTQLGVHSLATGGGMSTVVYATSLNGQVLLALRAKGGQDFTVLKQTLNVPGLWYNTLVSFHLSEGITNVANVQQSKNESLKILRNGQIVIIKNNKEFSILGQKL